jgi:hypothetical protein
VFSKELDPVKSVTKPLVSSQSYNVVISGKTLTLKPAAGYWTGGSVTLDLSGVTAKDGTAFTSTGSALKSLTLTTDKEDTPNFTVEKKGDWSGNTLLLAFEDSLASITLSLSSVIGEDAEGDFKAVTVGGTRVEAEFGEKTVKITPVVKWPLNAEVNVNLIKLFSKDERLPLEPQTSANSKTVQVKVKRIGQDQLVVFYSDPYEFGANYGTEALKVRFSDAIDTTFVRALIKVEVLNDADPDAPQGYDPARFQSVNLAWTDNNTSLSISPLNGEAWRSGYLYVSFKGDDDGLKSTTGKTLPSAGAFFTTKTTAVVLDIKAAAVKSVTLEPLVITDDGEHEYTEIFHAGATEARISFVPAVLANGDTIGFPTSTVGSEWADGSDLGGYLIEVVNKNKVSGAFEWVNPDGDETPIEVNDAVRFVERRAGGVVVVDVDLFNTGDVAGGGRFAFRVTPILGKSVGVVSALTDTTTRYVVYAGALVWSDDDEAFNLATATVTPFWAAVTDLVDDDWAVDDDPEALIEFDVTFGSPVLNSSVEGNVSFGGLSRTEAAAVRRGFEVRSAYKTGTSDKKTLTISVYPVELRTSQADALVTAITGAELEDFIVNFDVTGEFGDSFGQLLRAEDKAGNPKAEIVTSVTIGFGDHQF